MTTNDSNANPQPGDNAADTLYGAGNGPEDESSSAEDTAKKEGEEPGADDSADDQSQDDESKKDKDKEDDSDDEDPNKEFFGKPENGYDYTEIMPEGVVPNKELTEKFNTVIDKYNMSQKGANELVALAVELTQHTQTSIADAIAQANEARIDIYKEAQLRDKEIGGAKLDEVLKVAGLAYNLADAETKQFLKDSGGEYHPGIIKLFHKFGKQMQEDSVHSSSSAAKEDESPAQILYGKKDEAAKD